MPGKSKQSLNAFYKVNAKTAKIKQFDGSYKEMLDSNNQPITFDTFEGYLRNIEFKEGEYEGEKVYSVRFNFGEHTLEESVEFGMNSCCLSFLNTLTGKDLNGKVVEFRVYKGKDETGKEYRGSNIYVTLNGEKIGWAKEYSAISSMLDSNRESVVPAWKSMIENINTTLSPSNSPAMAEMTSEAPVAVTEITDDLPFG